VPIRWRIAVVTLLAGLIVAVVMLVSLLWTRKQADAAPSTAHPVTGPLAEFWRPFTSGTEEPWVIFSNAAFTGRPETGMRYYSSSRDSKTAVYDHYTGVGEVLAVHSLDEAFGSLGHKLRVKRGSLFTLDDANNAGAILELQRGGSSLDEFLWSFVEGKPKQRDWKKEPRLPGSTPDAERMSKALKKLGFRFVGQQRRPPADQFPTQPTLPVLDGLAGPRRRERGERVGLSPSSFIA